MPAEAPRANLTLELAHVLFMDIVGYSQLSMDEQEKQLRTLQDPFARPENSVTHRLRTN